MKEDDPRECVGDWASQELWKRDAEIERLKEAYDIVQDHLVKAEQRLRDKDKLITELCDALEEEYGSNLGDGHPSNLLQHAREATR